jgi:pseudaminic acid biosynthesis-associated methylase
MNVFKTDQEKFWMGEFGTKYSKRNIGEQLLASNIAFFSRIMARTTNVKSVIEFGANIGFNLIAIKNLLPSVELSAIEINLTAVKELEKLKKIKVYPISILDFKPDIQYDFVFTKGVLIHINPEKLPQVYDLLYQTVNVISVLLNTTTRPLLPSTIEDIPINYSKGISLERS